MAANLSMQVEKKKINLYSGLKKYKFVKVLGTHSFNFSHKYCNVFLALNIPFKTTSALYFHIYFNGHSDING